MRPPVPRAPRPSLLLVGGGHAHVEILRRLAKEDHPPVDSILLSAFAHHHYSGMAPGYLAGLYREEELALDLPALCRQAGARFVEGWAERVEPTNRVVRLADGRTLAYDLASFDVGSRAAGENTPGVAEHALGLKPLSKALAVRRRLEELGSDRETKRPATIVVVGGGAAGVETSFAVGRALDDHGRPRKVVLLEAGERILDRQNDRFRAAAGRALAERGVEAVTEARVEAVEEDGVWLRAGGRRPTDLVLWLTGPAPSGLFGDSGLPTDRRGFLSIDPTFRVPGNPELFAAGDCATPIGHPDTPKAGVYAVHQAPVLWRSLRIALEGGDPAREGVYYTPQRGFLSLLNVCDGTALLSWKGWSARGRWVWWLKDWIDRRFVRRYRRSAG